MSATVATGLGVYASAVERWDGADRYEVSANISSVNFPDGADTVFVANGLAAADALAAGPVAAMEGGPILLVKAAAIPAAIADELERLGPDRVVILGGMGSVAEDTERLLVDITDRERAVSDHAFDLVNEHRASIGVGPLIRDARIDAVAYAWSQVMVDRDTLFHNPDFGSQMPPGWYAAAENVAYSSISGEPSDTAAVLVRAWLNSEGHRANIENPRFTHTGIGFQITDGGAIYGTHNFGDYSP